MILDRPKRRAETMVGTVKVDNGEGLTDRKERMSRAIKEVEDKFCVKISKGDVFGEINNSGDLVVMSVTITAIIHREPLESRWARALDMIREQYGLDIEWERGEVTERTNYNKFVDAFVGHIAKVHGLPREVLGKVTQSESFGPLGQAADDWAVSRETALESNPLRLTPLQLDEMRQGAKVSPKSYADTPTGTVEWDSKKGRYIAHCLENLDGPEVYHFCCALHLVDLETGCGDFDIRCPVCGDYEMTDYYLYADHVSKLFGSEAGGDRDAIERLEAGVTCESCHHHLTYDFDQETVTMRRGE